LDHILNATPGTGNGTHVWAKLSGPGNAIFTPDSSHPDAIVTVNKYGDYQFIWTEVNISCQSSDIIKVSFHEIPSVSSGRDTIICKGDSVQLDAQGTGSFVWEPDTLLNDSNISNPIASPLESTLFKVTLTDQFACKNVDSIMIQVFSEPVAYAGPDQVLEYVFWTNMAANPLNINESGVWSLISGTGEVHDSTDTKTSVINLSTGENIFQWTVTNKVCPPSKDTVNIIVHDFKIPTLITPNMDGKNDFFVLNGIETLGKTDLTIFDRRGAQVFKNSNYDNKWNGVDYNGNPLPEDTYFFILKTANGKSISGYIVIRR
jgi:gliding motility-associated-like protein